jgi:hypothetical protein
LSQPKDNENYQELSKRILSLINYSKEWTTQTLIRNEPQIKVNLRVFTYI